MLAPWASQEMASVDLGDERLDARAVTVLSALGSRPTVSIPAACGGRAEMQAAYRFFDNDKVTFDKVLQPHIERTRERMAQQQTVLLVQDTTEIDVTPPELEMKGVGTLDGLRCGFLVHEMQAFTTEGTPLGTVWAEIVNRTDGVAHARARNPVRSVPERRSKRRRACVGSRDCGRRGRRPSNCRASTVSAWPTAKPTSMSCSPSPVASGRSIGCFVLAKIGLRKTVRSICGNSCWPSRCCTRSTC